MVVDVKQLNVIHPELSSAFALATSLSIKVLRLTSQGPLLRDRLDSIVKAAQDKDRFL